MGTISSPTSPSASSSLLLCKTTTTSITKTLQACCCLSTLHFRYPKFLSISPSLSKSRPSKPFATSSSSLHLPTSSPSKSRSSFSPVFSIVDEHAFAFTTSSGDPIDDYSLDYGSASNNLVRPMELYVCNFPRSCGISELLDLFKPYGTVQSVEVSRNAETGISRGCGCVIMSSIDEAKSAIAALDGSDVGGREMRVRFSVDMNMERKYLEPLSSKPQKNLVFETPYKIYIGNLAWAVKPHDLKDLFSQFGTVNSARVLHDRKGGKNRVYGFLSFSSPAECKDAMSLNGTEFFGRTMLIREVSIKNEL